MSDEDTDKIHPPLYYEPYLKDIPANKIYGKLNANPKNVRENDVTQLAKAWLDQFNSSLKEIEQDPSKVSLFDHLISEHAGWRDHLASTWDLRTFDTLTKIKNNIAETQKDFQIGNVSIDTAADYRHPSGVFLETIHEVSDTTPIPIEWVQVYLTFTNKFGRGKSLIRLISVDDDSMAPGGLKAFSLYFALEEIYGNEENIDHQRPNGVNHGQHKNRKTWLEKRELDQVYGDDHQPIVLIVGGGQNGLSTAARLKVMGIDSLIVEKNERIGDNWRNRYKFLVLHDPVWFDHMAYFPFPRSWPVFPPKDKIGDWFDTYARVLELNYKVSTTVTGGSFDEKTDTWTIELTDNKSKKTSFLHPKHVVMATGHSGEPNIPKFKNQEIFKGKILHSSQHSTGRDYVGQNAIVVGCCNSGHDIAQDFFEQGANPTIVQRSSTFVVTSEATTRVGLKGLYDESGPKTETADLIVYSQPLKLTNLMQQQSYRRQYYYDKKFIEGLKAKGFKVDTGYASTGLLGKYHRRGGGYYIDVGASKLICDGSIGLKSGVEIQEFTEDGVIFSDGSKIDDVSVVVLATGWSNMKETAARIFGPEVDKKLKPVWDFDEEGETKAMWRSSGHKNFWFMGGKMALARYYSKRLALQIVATERGFKS